MANRSAHSMGGKNIQFPPGIKDKVIELLKHKMDAGVYEHCQSAIPVKVVCGPQEVCKLRIVMTSRRLNAVINPGCWWTAILDDFLVENPFSGRQCYTVFDLFWGFDARRVHPN